MKARDWTHCNYCGDEEAGLTDYHGVPLCDECIEMDRTTDWEAWEEKRRLKISRENEY